MRAGHEHPAEGRGTLSAQTRASSNSGPFRKSYFLPRGCLCPRLALVGLGIAEEKPALSAWFSRVYREYEAGNLTPLWRDVLRALGRFDACRFGIFPSHQFLARRARCSVRTGLHRSRGRP